MPPLAGVAAYLHDWLSGLVHTNLDILKQIFLTRIGRGWLSGFTAFVLFKEYAESSGWGFSVGEQGWRSGESTRIPPMWPAGSIPGLDVICGLSLLLVLFSAPRGFFPGTTVFPSPQKPTFLNSNSFRNARAFNTWALGSGDWETTPHAIEKNAIKN